MVQTFVERLRTIPPVARYVHKDQFDMGKKENDITGR